jgi:hypothetical protein
MRVVKTQAIKTRAKIGEKRKDERKSSHRFALVVIMQIV